MAPAGTHGAVKAIGSPCTVTAQPLQRAVLLEVINVPSLPWKALGLIKAHQAGVMNP